MGYLSVIRYQSNQELALSQSTLINHDNPTLIFVEKLICIAKVVQFLLQHSNGTSLHSWEFFTESTIEAIRPRLQTHVEVCYDYLIGEEPHLNEAKPSFENQDHTQDSHFSGSALGHSNASPGRRLYRSCGIRSNCSRLNEECHCLRQNL